MYILNKMALKWKYARKIPQKYNEVQGLSKCS